MNITFVENLNLNFTVEVQNTINTIDTYSILLTISIFTEVKKNNKNLRIN